VKVRGTIPFVLCLLWAVAALGLTAEEQMRFADGIYLRGFHEAAVTEYLRFLRDFPDSEQAPSALYRTGESYRQMGNHAGAERFYRRVEQEHPESAQALRATLRRAEMGLSDGKPQEALALLDGLLEKPLRAEDESAVRYYAGLCRLRMGDGRAARKAFEKLLEDFPDSAQAAYAALELATLQADQAGSEAQMTAWFRKAVESAATPSAKAEALYRWGDWAYRRGEYALAADVLRSLIVEQPEQRRASDARLACGWSLYYLDRPEEALTMAEQALEKAGEADAAAAATYLRAASFRKMNRDGEALADYEAIAKLYPRSRFAASAAYEIMATHFKRGNYTEALIAAPAQPGERQEADVLWMRAESERHLGRLDLASGRYAALVDRFPDSPQAPSALLRLGELARGAGRMEEAAEWFGRVAQEYPEDGSADGALMASALARLQAGDPEGSLADWDRLLSRKPDAATAAEARLQKALALMELGRADGALSSLDDLLERHRHSEQSAKAHYWRGVLLSEREDWKAAESALASCLGSAPDGQTAALARLRLVVALQRQGRMDEAADQIDPLIGDPVRVSQNPALVEWAARHHFDQGDPARGERAARALADHAEEAAWRQIGWFWVGNNLREMDKEAEAAAAYEKAVAEPASTREGAEAQLLLAGLDVKAGRFESGAKRYASAAAVADDGDSLDLRVRAYFGMGEAAEAMGQLDAAARHYMSVAILFDDPEWSPRALYGAGELLGRQGKAEQQMAAWNELRSRYPESSYARQLEATNP
jgi:cellulose synthase operon protein C